MSKKILGEFRMIHHLSYPEGSSVNYFIRQEMSLVQYATIHDAISYIKRSPQSVYIAKVDVESEFRIMPVSPDERPLLVFQWLGKFYMDAVLPKGCSSSCAIFEYFNSALEWVVKHKLEASEVVHVIDDFLFVAHSAGKCEHDLMAFIDLCNQLGVQLAPGKTVGLSSSITFLGIILDAVRMEAILPDDKLLKAGALLLEFTRK